MEGDKGTYEIRIHSGTNTTAIDRIVAHLGKLDPTSLGISGNGQLQALPSLQASTNLNIVRIANNGKIEGLPELGDVDRLEVIAFDADDIGTTIEALKGLPTTITIETLYDDDRPVRRSASIRSAGGAGIEAA